MVRRGQFMPLLVSVDQPFSIRWIERKACHSLDSQGPLHWYFILGDNLVPQLVFQGSLWSKGYFPIEIDV